jgi:hypothetical protein
MLCPHYAHTNAQPPDAAHTVRCPPLAVRVDVSGATGEVSNIEFLADTLVVVPGHEPESANLRATLQHLLVESLAQAEFPVVADGRDSSITLPVVLD